MMDLNLPNVIIIIGAFSAMIIELIPVSLDDNLRIPLFSGTIMYAMSIVLI
jgi:dolichol kinase